MGQCVRQDCIHQHVRSLTNKVPCWACRGQCDWRSLGTYTDRTMYPRVVDDVVGMGEDLGSVRAARRMLANLSRVGIRRPRQRRQRWEMPQTSGWLGRRCVEGALFQHTRTCALMHTCTHKQHGSDALQRGWGAGTTKCVTRPQKREFLPVGGCVAAGPVASVETPAAPATGAGAVVAVVTATVGVDRDGSWVISATWIVRRSSNHAARSCSLDACRAAEKVRVCRGGGGQWSHASAKHIAACPRRQGRPSAVDNISGICKEPGGQTT